MSKFIAHDLAGLLLGRSANANQELQPKWMQVYGRLSIMAPLSFINQNDYYIDLVLRKMEGELSIIIEEEFKNPACKLAETYMMAGIAQDTMTKMWVLSTYEIIRIARASDAGKNNDRLDELYRLLTLVRMPLAKGEIAAERHLPDQLVLERVGDGYTQNSQYIKNSTKNYIPASFIRSLTGSIGWHVVQSKPLASIEITRRELSDLMLNLFEEAPVD
ncbi:hypothetical protein MKL09_21890 [Methylobacterium sp. J-048]|uniref:hypothetical protein n=1 Tax=Methylobacterium sp. J-048 TaxID=2836635 RepID=UPI001FBC0591|nr:hypothetical protein [Methylobacterium sp. J-048]MCJ2059180.1 hypothetical protein [Methylobacterium sp. J-048]